MAMTFSGHRSERTITIRSPSRPPILSAVNTLQQPRHVLAKINHRLHTLGVALDIAWLQSNTEISIARTRHNHLRNQK
jgi:hypothetical protein